MADILMELFGEREREIEIHRRAHYDFDRWLVLVGQLAVTQAGTSGQWVSVYGKRLTICIFSCIWPSVRPDARNLQRSGPSGSTIRLDATRRDKWNLSKSYQSWRIQNAHQTVVGFCVIVAAVDVVAVGSHFAIYPAYQSKVSGSNLNFALRFVGYPRCCYSSVSVLRSLQL